MPASAWPYGVPPAVVQPGPKANDLPSPTLLPSLTRSSSSSTSSPSFPSKPTTGSAYLSHPSSSYTPPAHSFTSPTPLSRRPSSTPSSSSSQPPLTPGLYHPSRLSSSTSAPLPTGKPRWFTNRLALSLPPSSHVNFSLYQPHHPSAHTPHHWTRDDMVREILQQQQRDTAKLRKQRAKLDQQLARAGVARGYRGYRQQLLQWLQGEDCRLFEGASEVISVQDEELDVVLEVGGCHLRDVGGRVGKRPAFLVYLQQLNDAGVRCESYEQLVKLLGMARRQAEEEEEQSPQPGLASPVAAPAQPVAAEPAETEAEPEPEEQPAVAQEEPTAAEQPAGEAEAQSEVAEPEVVQPEEAAPVVQAEEAAGGEPAEREAEPETADDDSAFVEPSTSRARMDSVLEGHARHNTVVDDDDAAAAPLNVPTLMEKLNELEEENERATKPTAEAVVAPPAAAASTEPAPPAVKEAAAAESQPSEWEETGDHEDVAL